MLWVPGPTGDSPRLLFALMRNMRMNKKVRVIRGKALQINTV
jgi:hypothetical protein